MNICVVGDLQDLTLVYVAHLAKRRAYRVIELAEKDLGRGWAFSFDDSHLHKGKLLSDGNTYNIADIAGIYVRLSSEPELPPELEDLGPEEAAALIRERRSALQYFLNRFPGTVVNRPAAGRSNGSKPYQMRRLEQAGFTIPKWMASNDVQKIEAFAGTFKEGVIYKSCSGLRARARLYDEEIRQRLRQGTTPIVVQQYIPGNDVRLHTINDHAFATRVISQEVDYRFSETDSEYESIAVPDEILRTCQEVAEQEGLAIAGFDFRVTEASKWYCLEVNPVPTFLPYEMLAKQPIADAVLNLIVSREAVA
jgi:glutathione synthase/RimK-type ligase-like ATP-grasp enzyme